MNLSRVSMLLINESDIISVDGTLASLVALESLIHA